MTRAAYNAEGRTLTLNAVRDTLLSGFTVGDDELIGFLSHLCPFTQELEFDDDPMIMCVVWIGGKQKQARTKMAKLSEQIKSGFGSGVADDVPQRKQKK